MKRWNLFFCALTLSLTAAGDEPYNWKLVTDNAGWQARDSQGEVVFRDQLWIFGGWHSSYAAPPRDVWSSADGHTWKQVTDDGPWLHSDLSMSLAFRDRMWFMGGWYNGRLPGHSASNMVWSSADGKTWKQETEAAGWSPRLAAAIVEFRGRMWVLGGSENYYFGDESSLKNDVWSSADGIHWEQATASAEWDPRAYHQAAVLNDRLYVFGGGNYVPEYKAFNDVWSSADGIEWRQETDAAPWPGRLWFSSVVYRDQMWVLGGWSNNPSVNHGDVWHSKNGRDWQQLKSDVIWKERHEHSAFVFRDRIWVAGGHARPLSNDVWSLHLPEDWGQ
ncbi:MAG: galactose oxidase [Fuerstiella sp.]